MEETLKCTSCSKKWTRPKTRGRKPTFCPTCIANATEPPKEVIQNITKPLETKENTTENNSCIREDKKIISSVYKYFFPEVEDEQLKNQKSGSKWQCPSCGYVLTVFVKINDIPYHKCTPSSTSKRELKRIS
jgi:predicted RNA-binding Zn-ribbon protein involved in translation (DUF1610 family)